MKLKKWLKYLDPMIDAIIFTDKNKVDEPAWQGSAFDIPKKYKNMKIGRQKWDNTGEEPIFITHHINRNGVTLEQITINLLEK